LAAFAEAPGGIFALYPPGRHLTAKLRALLDFLSPRLQRPNWAR
jgi:DNA-binding transcriptional LysR family regulator